MANKYIDEITRYTKKAADKGQPIKRRYIESIIDIYLETEGLSQYVQNVTFNRVNDILFDSEIDNIDLDMNLIFKWFGEIEEFSSLPKNEKYLALYIFVNQTLLHELKHIKDFDKCKDNTNDFETQIIKKCYGVTKDAMFLKSNIIRTIRYYIRQYLYDHFYDFCPLERFAELTAIKDTITSTKILELPSLQLYWQHELYQEYIKAYETQNSPTTHFLNMTGSWSLANDLCKAEKDMDFKKRLYLGLSLTKEELNMLQQREVKLARKLTITN